MSDPQHKKITLKPSFTSDEAELLRGELSSLKEVDLAIDCSDVELLSALGAEVLLSAKETWAANGRSISFIDASDSLLRDVALLGLADRLDMNAETK